MDRSVETFQEKAELEDEILREKRGICYSVSKTHIQVIMLICTLYLAWMSVTGRIVNNLVGACLGTLLSVTPLLAFRKINIGRVPYAVLLIYPMICNFIHVHLAFTRNVESRAIHVLCAYVHNMIGIIEYSTTRTQGFFLMLIHFGSWIWLLGPSSMPEINEVMSGIGIVLVSIIWFNQRLRYQKQLMNNHFRLKKEKLNTGNLLSRISENIAVLRSDFRIEMQNDGFARTFANVDFIQKAQEIRLENYSNRSLFDGLLEFFRHETLFTTLIFHIDGRLHSGNCYKLEWSGKQAVALISQDITETMHRERDKSKFEGMASTLRSVTHEIKTPINFIWQCSSIVVRRESSLSKESQKMLTRIGLLSHYLICFVSDIVDFTVAKYSALQLHTEKVSLHVLVDEILEILKALKQKSQKIEVYIGASVPSSILVDGTRLKQVLLNVSSNCMRFENDMKLKLSYGFGQLFVFVKALGIFFDEEFFTESARGSVNENVFIRLELIKGTLKALGGTELTIKQGKSGSVVHFCIEVEEENSDTSDYSVPDEGGISLVGPGNSAIDILIVDDSPLSLQVLLENLTTKGYRCETAINGQECLKKILQLQDANTQVLLIIMDCQMPVMNGWECTAKLIQLHQSGQLLHLPYILGYSSFGSPEDQQSCLDCGMNLTLPKPTSNTILYNTIHKALTNS